MSIDNFIPEIWSDQLLVSFKNRLVYAQPFVCNRDYEGDIAQAGDTVRINSIGAPTVGDYVKNSDLTSPETLTDAQLQFTVDQAKFFNFYIDDVDKRQQQPKVMAQAMREAAYAVAVKVDSFISGKYTDVPSANLIGSDTTPETFATPAAAYEALVDLSVILDQNNVPEVGRWCVVPPWFKGLLLKDDRFVSFGTGQNRAALANGQIGDVSGMAIMVSNTVPNTSGAKYKIIAGCDQAITFAEQISEVQPYKPEKRFGDAVKGLFLYGAKVVRPTLLAVMTANKP